MRPRQIRRIFFAEFFRLTRALWPILSGVLFAMIGPGLLIGHIEGWRIVDALYFTFVTGLTIGYGDLTPRHVVSRLLAVVIGLAGIMQFSRLTVGDPTVTVGFELDVIAAVVIGGASLNGGQGSILGSVIGAIFMTTIANGFAQLGWPESYRIYITGAIIVFAVALDQRRQGKVTWTGLGLLVLSLAAIGYIMFDWYPGLK